METKQRVLSVRSRTIAGALDQCKFYSKEQKSKYVLEQIRRFGKYIDRDQLERAPEFKQIVSCAVVYRDNKILCIRRTKKSNRRALALRWTVMIGGHVDDLDEGSKSPILNCLLRELREELGVIPISLPELIGVVFDPATPVGRLHLGIVYKAKIDSDQIKVGSIHDNTEFVNSNKNNVYNLMDYDQIQSLARKFDPWSTLFLKSEAATTILNAPRDSIPDKELELRWN